MPPGPELLQVPAHAGEFLLAQLGQLTIAHSLQGQHGGITGRQRHHLGGHAVLGLGEGLLTLVGYRLLARTGVETGERSPEGISA